MNATLLDNDNKATETSRGRFGWLRKKPPEPVAEQPPARAIFSYHDGTRQRFADPIAVMRAMLSHPTLVLDQHLKELASEDMRLQSDASAIVSQATREIFGLEPWSESNLEALTEMEVLDVLTDFVLFTDGLKKNGNG